MFNYIKDCLTTKYADFNGRARRSEYWYYTLGSMIIFVFASILDNILGTKFTTSMGAIPVEYGYIYLLVGLVTFIPTIAVGTRRLHDLGKTGWYQLLWFFIFIGWIWLLVLMCTDSQPGENEYGPNPKGIGNNNGTDDLINSIGNQQ